MKQGSDEDLDEALSGDVVHGIIPLYEEVVDAVEEARIGEEALKVGQVIASQRVRSLVDAVDVGLGSGESRDLHGNVTRGLDGVALGIKLVVIGLDLGLALLVGIGHVATTKALKEMSRNVSVKDIVIVIGCEESLLTLDMGLRLEMWLRLEMGLGPDELFNHLCRDIIINPVRKVRSRLELKLPSNSAMINTLTSVPTRGRRRTAGSYQILNGISNDLLRRLSRQDALILKIQTNDALKLLGLDHTHKAKVVLQHVRRDQIHKGKTELTKVTHIGSIDAWEGRKDDQQVGKEGHGELHLNLEFGNGATSPWPALWC
jgi:hypothetical protein